MKKRSKKLSSWTIRWMVSLRQVEETIEAIRADGNGSPRHEADLDAANDLLDLLREKKSIEEAMTALLDSPLAQLLMPGQRDTEKPARKLGFRTEKE